MPTGVEERLQRRVEETVLRRRMQPGLRMHTGERWGPALVPVCEVKQEGKM